MSNLITLTCPSCGGRLEVTNNTERYVCAHCGNSHLVEPGVRVDSLMSEVEILKYDEQIRRVEAKIESHMEQQRQAWEAYEVAEKAVTKQRSDKQSGLFVGGAGLIVILIALGAGSALLILGGIMCLTLGIIFRFAYDDSEVLANRDTIMQQIEASRGAIQQQQRELARLRMEQTSKRLETEARSPAQSR